MKVLKWILFIPISAVIYYLFLFILVIVNNLFTAPPPNDNPILNNYIIPIIINAIGIATYFFVGNMIIQYTNKVDNKLERLISNICLLITISLASIYFGYLCFRDDEYYKGIINIVNLLVSGVAFLVHYKKEK